MNFNNDIEENRIINIIDNYDFTQYHGGHDDFDHKHILEKYFQESCTMDALSRISESMSYDALTSGSSNEAIENFQEKIWLVDLNIEHDLGC